MKAQKSSGARDALEVGTRRRRRTVSSCGLQLAPCWMHARQRRIRAKRRWRSGRGQEVCALWGRAEGRNAAHAAAQTLRYPGEIRGAMRWRG